MNDESQPSESAEPEVTFLEMLRAARAGNSEALGKLVQGNRDYLLLIANQELGEQLRAKAGASDVVQETFALAHRNIRQFEGASPEELRGWLRTILKNQIGTLSRQFSAAKRDVQREGHESNASQMRDLRPTPRTTAAQEEEAEQLRLAMQTLSESHRQVIILRNWEQLSFPEVAENMQRSVEATKKLWGRAIGQLKKELARGKQQEAEKP
ncbi:MAG: sigma-70 family RNA polymerase sigma factor [Planctomycetota bacterium]